MKTWRVVLGVALSPLAAPVLVLLWPIVLPGGERPYTSTNIWWVAAASALCSYVGMFVLGLPILYALKVSRRLTIGWVVSAGAIAGAFEYSLIHIGIVSTFHLSEEGSSIRYIRGAILGLSVSWLAATIAGIGYENSKRKDA